MGAGRPNEMLKIDYEHVRDMAELGFTPARIARELGISEASLSRYCRLDAEFGKIVGLWEQAALKNVERRLYQLAEGYEITSEKLFYDSRMGVVVRAPVTEHYKPDVAAAKFLLTNKAPEDWKERRTDDVSVGGRIELAWLDMTEDEFLE